MALAHNEALQKADNDLRKAELDKAIAFTSYLPAIESSATGAYVVEDIDMMGMQMQMKGTYMAGITLTQPLYAGGKIIAGNKLARIGVECAAENQRKTRMQGHCRCRQRLLDLLGHLPENCHASGKLCPTDRHPLPPDPGRRLGSNGNEPTTSCASRPSA